MIETAPPPVPEAPMIRLLRAKDVIHRIGCGKSTLYRMLQAGAFPRPIELTPRWRAWPEAVVDAWIAAQVPPDPSLN